MKDKDVSKFDADNHHNVSKNENERPYDGNNRKKINEIIQQDNIDYTDRNKTQVFVTRDAVVSGQLVYAEIRKMEIKGVSRFLKGHLGCNVADHIRYCTPLIRGGVVND